MNLFDIIVVVILCYCVIRGIFRGLIKELFSLIGVLGGFYAAYTYYMVLAKPLSRWIANAGHLNILSFLIIFCFVFIIISILGIIIHYILNIAFLGWVDRICGAVFGTAKGILIASVLLISLTAFLPTRWLPRAMPAKKPDRTAATAHVELPNTRASCRAQVISKIRTDAPATKKKMRTTKRPKKPFSPSYDWRRCCPPSVPPC